jgi:bifunctional non-homologous end joining protein LigD
VREPREPGSSRKHAARRRRAARAAARGDVPRVAIPGEADAADVVVGPSSVHLTNLRKLFFRHAGLTKGDVLRHYADVAPLLLPHLVDRAMVMKRYPDGAEGKWFFMKRAPAPRPEWIETCEIEHRSGNVISFPMAQDVASLLWLVNLGCIDLNPWYARCDDVDRPDFLHFDLDPVAPAGFDQIREAALYLREALDVLGMPSYPKTTGSRGIHVYVPIVRGPRQKQVWTIAKGIAQTLERANPRLVTAEYRIERRPRGRVLVDYNQNAWGRTLASVYSIRPTRAATVSVPLRWTELERGVSPEEFTVATLPARVHAVGDLWEPLLAPTGRFDLGRLL